MDWKPGPWKWACALGAVVGVTSTLGACTARTIPDDLEFNSSASSSGPRPDPDEGQPIPIPDPDYGEEFGEDGYEDGYDEGYDEGYEDGYDDGWIPDFFHPGPDPANYDGEWVMAIGSPILSLETYHYVAIQTLGGEDYAARTAALSRITPPPDDLVIVGDSSEGWGYGDGGYLFLEFYDLDIPGAALGPNPPVSGATVGQLLLDFKPLTGEVACGRAVGHVESPSMIPIDEPAGLVRSDALDAWALMYASCF